MRILALDLSSKTGWALLEDQTVLCFGSVTAPKPAAKLRSPYDIVNQALRMGALVRALVNDHKPECIVTEQTNQAKKQNRREDQKLLEFIHFAVIQAVMPMRMVYLDSRLWRKAVGITLTAEDSARNKAIKKKRAELKAALKAELEREITERHYHAIMTARMSDDKRAIKALQKKAKAELKEEFTKRVRKLPRDGTTVGKVTPKHLAIRKVKELFNLTFKQKENDTAEAILIGLGLHLLLKSNSAELECSPV